MRLVCKQESKREVNLKCMLSSEKKVFHLIHKCTCIKNVFFFFFWQLATWFFTTFTASDIKNKVISMRGVQYLYGTIFPDQLDIPSFVINYDIEVNNVKVRLKLVICILMEKKKKKPLHII